MKRWIIYAIAFGMVQGAYAGLADDDFNSGHTPGNSPAGWSTTDIPGEVPPQVDLITVEAGAGKGMSQGLSVDVTKTKRNYIAKYTEGVSGAKLTLTAEFQIATSGEALTNTFNGVNDPMIGFVVGTDPDWATGPHFLMSFCRRADDFFGFRLPPPDFVLGYIGNSSIGLAPGLTASTSDWFRITIQLTDTGVNWNAYLECFADGESLPLYTSPTYTLPFASGETLYGGISPNWNSDDVPIGEVGKLTGITVDNFLFGPPTIKIKALAVEDIVAYGFTSVTGKIHRLQYSFDAITYQDTGAYTVGDGSYRTLQDPAVDTSGRTYRVTSD